MQDVTHLSTSFGACVPALWTLTLFVLAPSLATGIPRRLSERTPFVAKRPRFCSTIGRNQDVIACLRKETSHKQGVSFALRQAARALVSGKGKGQRGAPQGAPLLGHER